MAVDMFLKIDTVDGESQDAKHAKEIQINSFSWEAAQTGTSGIGGGSGTGKVEHQDLVITKYVDRASPLIYKLTCKGEHLKSAVLTVRKAGGDALEYLIMKLEDIMITSFVLGGDPKNDLVTETLRINFTRAVITYTPQDKAGTGEGAISHGWDLAANAPFDTP
jgi:type VI secretion system secreted protein Hcp